MVWMHATRLSHPFQQTRTATPDLVMYEVFTTSIDKIFSYDQNYSEKKNTYMAPTYL